MRTRSWHIAFGITTFVFLELVTPLQLTAAQTHEDSDLTQSRSADSETIHAPLPEDRELRKPLADTAVQLMRPDAPDSVRHARHAEMLAPPFLPSPRRLLPPSRNLKECSDDHVYSQGAFPTVINQNFSNADPTGCEGTYLPDGPVTVATHPFFQLLGTNGRSCATCHQPPSGMSVSLSNINARLKATSGTDPIFAGVDGANCPSKLPPYTGNGSAFKAAHSLLLQRGLFRISESLPTGAEFTISAVGHDPNGCNTVAPNNEDLLPGETVPIQMVSVYRRPRISANLNFVTSFVSTPPAPPSSAAIMWDLREDTLAHQVLDATHGHAQGTVPPSTAEVEQIVNFETRIFAAQSSDRIARSLNTGGAEGGAVALSAKVPSTSAATAPQITFNEYQAWSGASGGASAARRASIARGENLFNTKSISLLNVAGVTDVPGLSNPFSGNCSGCHSQPHSGNELLGSVAKIDIGIDGGSVPYNPHKPSTDLPIFTITCIGGASTSYNGSTVMSNDPGAALFSGKCADIGKYSVPQLRNLSARAPYFHDGSAKTLWDVVDFYDRRFKIGLTYAEKEDLVNFLSSL